MNMNFLRAVTLASLSLFATTAIMVPQAAYAKEKQEAPKISREFSKPLAAANKALQAKDWKTAIAKLKEAEALEDPKPYETWVTEYYLSVAYISSGDKAGAVAAIKKAVAIKDVPAKNHQLAVDLGLQIIAEAASPQEVVDFVKANIPEGTPLKEGTAHNIAFAYYKLDDFENVVKYESQAIQLAETAGKVPPRYEYKLLEIAHSKLKQMPEMVKYAGLLAEKYGTDDDWNQYLDLQTGMLSNAGAKGKTLENAAYYIYKLRIVTGIKAKKSDYLEAAQLAHDRRLPNDVITAIKAGEEAGEITKADKKVMAFLRKAERSVAGDKKTLPKADKAAAKSKHAAADLSIAADYISYGQYEDAERVANRAIAKGDKSKAEAQLMLGVAQALQDKPEAVDTLAQVTDPVLKISADCWASYAKHKAAKAAAAAAPAAPAAPPAQ